MKNKTIIKILIICIIILVIGLIATCIVYFTTDLLKPSDKVFKKYYSENIKRINQIVDFSKEDSHFNFLKTTNYNDTLSLKMIYTNSAGSLEQFSGTIVGQTDNSSKTSYRKINIKYGDNIDILNAEYMRENPNYALLFSDVLKNSISVDYNNIDEVLSKMNIEKEQIEKYKIIETLGTFEEKKAIIENEITKFVQNSNKNQFSLQKEKIITLTNAQSVTSNVYSLKLNDEQVKRLYINTLKEMGRQDLIDSEKKYSELALSLYVSENKLVRVTYEYENKNIIADIFENEINIKYTKKTEEQAQNIDINIKNENGNKTITYNDQYNIAKIELTTNQLDKTSTENIKVDFQNEQIKNLKIQLEQNIEIVESVNIEKKIKDQADVSLNSLDTSTLYKAINSLLNKLNSQLTEKNQNANSEILNNIINSIQKYIVEYSKIKEQEKNQFNNHLLLYRGENIEKNVIYNMLDYVGNNMSDYQLYGDNIKIIIKEGIKNTQKAEELKQKVDSVNENYNISFQYDSEGKISVILMKKNTTRN